MCDHRVRANLSHDTTMVTCKKCLGWNRSLSPVTDESLAIVRESIGGAQ